MRNGRHGGRVWVRARARVLEGVARTLPTEHEWAPPPYREHSLVSFSRIGHTHWCSSRHGDVSDDHDGFINGSG